MLDQIRALLGRRPRVLFVCSQNRLRSRTAEAVFDGRDGIAARSAGTLPVARVRVDEALVSWADIVFGMEAEHVDCVRQRFPAAAAGKVLVLLEIPDEYDYMQPELVALLEAKVVRYLPGGGERTPPDGA
jgi:predicted protein tyrosine phosphatase